MRHVFMGLLVVAILMAPLLSNAALNIKDKDLLLYLPCDEGSGKTVADLSPNGFNGEIVGTVGWTDGKYKKCLEFNEAGEVKCPYIELNDKSFTVCLWTKPKLAGGAEQCVFTQTQANATNTSLHFRIYGAGNVRMGFYNNDLDAFSAVKADEWAHICFWLDVKGKSRKIYINGKMTVEDQGKSGIAYLGNAGDTMVGSWGGTGQKYNGLIDEVQVWNRALTEKEVQESMGQLTALAVGSLGKLATAWGNVKFYR